MKDIEHIYMNVPMWTGRKIEEGTPWLDAAAELESILSQLDSLLGEFGGIGFSSQMGTLSDVTDGINAMRDARKYLHEEIVRLVDKPLEECFARAVETLAAIDFDEIRVANNAGVVVNNADVGGQSAASQKVNDYSLSDVLKGNVPELNKCVGYNQKIDGFGEILEEMGGFTLASLMGKNDESDEKSLKEDSGFFENFYDDVLDLLGFHCESGHCGGPIGNPPQQTMEEIIRNITEDVFNKVNSIQVLIDGLYKNQDSISIYQERDVTHKEEFQIGKPVGELINGWLQMYDNVTVEAEGRMVTAPKGTDLSKWAMKEDKQAINIYAEAVISGQNQVIVGSEGELLDQTGRYWIAVGPNVMNPEHGLSERCLADEMKYGTPIDVVVSDKEGNIFFIPCIVGECKEHTYPTGIVQTGYAFPDGTDYHPENVDYSIVEFCGRVSIQNLEDYKLEYLIIYD